MQLTYKNKFGETLTLKTVDGVTMFKHSDICNEFKNLFPLEYVFDSDERRVICSFVELCTELTELNNRIKTI
jgi:hypothetical protein